MVRWYSCEMYICLVISLFFQIWQSQITSQFGGGRLAIVKFPWKVLVMPDPPFPIAKGKNGAIYEWYTPRQLSLQLDLPSLTFHVECGKCNPSTPSHKVLGMQRSPAFI